MIKVKNTKVIEVNDWDDLVSDTYGKVYALQQQEGCQDRGMVHITIPSECTDEYMADSIPEVVNDEKMGVKFDVWLARDPNEWNGKPKDKMFVNMWWERNFYPSLQMVANDLYEKDLIEAGEYEIKIDW